MPSKIFSQAIKNRDYKNKDLLTDIWKEYFQGKEAENDIEKAYFAYHVKQPAHPDAHTFVGEIDKSTLDQPEYFYKERCNQCWRTRREIRWDDGHAVCMAALIRKYSYPEQVIEREERGFLLLLESAKIKIPEILKQRFNGELTAAALFYLQSTTGFPPDVVATFTEQNLEPIMAEFDKLMDEHRAKSGSFKKRIE